MTLPPWLPPLLNLPPSDRQACTEANKHFQSCAALGCSLNGLPVYWDTWPAHTGFCHAFVHLASQEVPPGSGNRQLNRLRMERIPWWFAIVQNVGDPAIEAWISLEKGQRRVYLWLRSESYVVVLGERERQRVLSSYHLITAYYVDGRSGERKLRQSQDNRISWL